MTWGYGHCGFTCQSQCPPCQMVVQPPSFIITIPGPMLSCSNDTLAVDCNNPCGYGGWGGWGNWGGWGGCGRWGGHGFGHYGGWRGYNGYCGGWGRQGSGYWRGCGW